MPVSDGVRSRNRAALIHELRAIGAEQLATIARLQEGARGPKVRVGQRSGTLSRLFPAPG